MSQEQVARLVRSIPMLLDLMYDDTGHKHATEITMVEGSSHCTEMGDRMYCTFHVH
jgi:hypothetical protein